MRNTLWRVVAVLSVIGMVFSATAFAEVTGETTYTDDPSIVITLTGELNTEGKVDLSWNEYEGSDLQYYKVVNSTTVENPVYPEDSYIEVISDVATVAYMDASVPAGVSYYSVCVITTDSMRGCSDGLMIENGEATADPTDPYTDDPAIVVTLTGELNAEGKVDLAWNEYDGGDLQYYKVVNSTTVENPVYPTDSYIEVISDVATVAYTDASVPAGVSYYSVCVITTASMRGCSDGLMIENGEATTDKPDSVADPYTDDPTIELTLEGELNSDGQAFLSWSEYMGDDLKWYKVVHSTVNEEAYYPVDGYVKVYSDSAIVNYTHAELTEGNNYFRVCVITNDDRRGCSNTVNLASDGTVAPSAFADTEDHWAKEYVNDLADKGVVEGRDGLFEPNAYVLRAEAVKMVLLGLEFSSDSCDASLFPDLATGDWFCNVVTKAFEMGVLQGDKGYLYPARNMTRAEAVKILIESKGITPPTVEVDPFLDVSKDAWYAGYVYKANLLGYVEGEGDYFYPNREITRAELAKIVSLAGL